MLHKWKPIDLNSIAYCRDPDSAPRNGKSFAVPRPFLTTLLLELCSLLCVGSLSSLSLYIQIYAFFLVHFIFPWDFPHFLTFEQSSNLVHNVCMSFKGPRMPRLQKGESKAGVTAELLAFSKTASTRKWPVARRKSYFSFHVLNLSHTKQKRRAAWLNTGGALFRATQRNWSKTQVTGRNGGHTPHI